jgi:hypothetical protein
VIRAAFGGRADGGFDVPGKVRPCILLRTCMGAANRRGTDLSPQGF